MSGLGSSPGGSDGKASACNVGGLGSIPGLEDPLEKEMATYSSTLAWKIPWTEEPGRLQSHGVAELDTTEQLHFHFHTIWPAWVGLELANLG